jgi:hypothetical protein
MRDKTIRPAGFCAGWQEWSEEEAKRCGLPFEVIRREIEERLPFKDKYHTHGHATKVEAERCYYEYELSDLRQGTCHEDEQHRCGADVQISEWFRQRCERFTKYYLGLRHGGIQIFLCDEHRNAETFGKIYLFVPGREIISSY